MLRLSLMNSPVDSSLTVKDVVKEFQPGGRLAQHSHGEVRDTFQAICVYVVTFCFVALSFITSCWKSYVECLKKNYVVWT